MRHPATSVDEILGLYQRWGDKGYDEELSQSSHAAQVAAWAVAEGADDCQVAAALLHDVGHLLVMEDRDDAGTEVAADLQHELLGARYLSGLFPPEVTRPIALHVQAKRYRCAVDPGEVQRLSAGSQTSLARQGGPMTAEEAAHFARQPSASDALHLRIRDDAGKLLDADVAPVASYRPLLGRLAVRR